MTATTTRAVGVVVAGTAEQPAFAVAKALAERATAAGSATGAAARSVSVCGNPDARPGRAIEAHLRVAVGRDDPPGPLVLPGECDLVVGLEPLEALRAATTYYTPGMQVVAWNAPILPTSVLHKGRDYPDVAGLAAQLADAGVQFQWLEPGRSGQLTELIEAAATTLPEVL